ncbi:EamA family transporter [Chloroflexota bacterium]
MRKDVITGRAFALTAAMAYGVSNVLVRLGVTDLAPPLVSATLALLSGTLVLAMIGGRNLGGKLRQKKKLVVFLIISGICSGSAVVSSFFALSMVPIVVAGPLQSTPPLVTLVLSLLFLRKLERITRRLVLGTVLVVVGITLVTIGRVV